MVGRIYRWYARVGDDPRLAVAQAANLYRQVPLLYGLLLINSLAVAMTHHASAPALLTVTVPALLFLFTAVRLVRWARVARLGTVPGPIAARRHLRVITALAAPVATAYLVWALLLMGYGGPAQQAHAAVYLSTTVIGCVFCLMVLPQAAVLVAVMVVPAFVLSCFAHYEIMFAVIATNVALVVAVLMRVLLNGFALFRDQVAARATLEQQHAELAWLNADNGRLALTDSLTALPNRRRFQQDLHRLATAPDSPRFVVGLLDLDRFKPVNDTYGHQVGDRLLIALARRMQSLANPATTIYRLGGDEFGLLITGDQDEAIAAAAWLCQSIAAPVSLGVLRLCVGGSLGVACSDSPAGDADALFDRADYALYQAKRVSGGTCVFTPEMARAIGDDRAIEAALRGAVLDDELGVVAQPIVSTATRAVAAIELLARWHSPQLGEIAPEALIAAAERCSLVHAVTLTLLRRGLTALRGLPPSLALSFNLSACDLHSPAALAAIEREIAAAGVAPERIWVEVTEAAVARDRAAAARALGQLRARGMKVVLDDFGADSASLNLLRELPLDTVKLDGRLIGDMPAGSGAALAEAVVALCRSLALDCVGEAVETSAQLDTLLRIGCARAQGTLFSPPIALDAVPALLRDGARERAAA
ncbi:EAL domain-containing protein [Sphingomonas sp. BK235]|uniref:putative bifunctional diguanylate cyclase/phosphodiesterase n=1 Tax=Sphingomonas sp. BK235 TaxID=2512131 RepID=UPI00104EA892|nr:EAL domain-containing protein [Sphingomonas sp. BK235]TCP32898.1 diguanylate cyclase (GGDEF)-like protein [Sphingomonas sp. BK235]